MGTCPPRNGWWSWSSRPSRRSTPTGVERGGPSRLRSRPSRGSTRRARPTASPPGGGHRGRGGAARGIEKVEVRIDAGPWLAAELGTADTEDTWRQWVLRWRAVPGSHMLTVRAIDGTGALQTEEVAPAVPGRGDRLPHDRGGRGVAIVRSWLADPQAFRLAVQGWLRTSRAFPIATSNRSSSCSAFVVSPSPGSVVSGAEADRSW